MAVQLRFLFFDKEHLKKSSNPAIFICIFYQLLDMSPEEAEKYLKDAGTQRY